MPGLLIKLPVKEGQNVAQGAVIAQLREDEFQARLNALQGQLDQGRAALAALRAGERPEEKLRRESQVRAAEATLSNARTDSIASLRWQDQPQCRRAGGLRSRRDRLSLGPRRLSGCLADVREGNDRARRGYEANEAAVRVLEKPRR